MGHKKRMHVMRMEWIDEGKPRSSVHEDPIFDDPALHPRENGEREKTATRVAPIFEKAATERPKTPQANGDAEMDDIYDATPRPARQQLPESGPEPDLLFKGAGSIFGPAKTAVVDDGPPEDDLDALLAEEEMLQASSGNAQPAPAVSKAPVAQEDTFDDEMEAMAEMESMW